MAALALVALTTEMSSQRASWYVSYDEAVRHVQRKEWRLAEEKLNAAKKEGPRPGRRVLRYGMRREPYLPDFYLAQVYAGLAEEQTDPEARRQYFKRALDALATADGGQVSERDPEFKSVQEIQLVARNALAPVTIAGGAKPTDEKPRSDEAIAAARRDIQRLVEQGDKALAAAAWASAVDAWQQANTRLEEVPSLRPEFSQVVTERLREATFGRDIAAALQLLQAGRFGAAAGALQAWERQLGEFKHSTGPVGALASDVSERMREAQAGQALMAAEDAFRNRQWSAAARAFELARPLLPGVSFSSPQAKALAALVPARLTEATLNAAVAEKRFADALAIDPTNRAALDNQYARAADAYNAGHWQNAAADFALLLKYAPTYRDVADRKQAADMQVQYGMAMEADQSGNAAAARQHFDTVVQLQRGIRGPLLGSAAVVRTLEGATDRLRRIDAKAGLATAHRQYENGQWDEARNSVNLVLRLMPDDQEAALLLRRLNDTLTGQHVQTLIRSAKEALSRGELDQATADATALQALLPQNNDAAFILAEVDLIQRERRQRYQWIAMAAAIMSVGPLLLISSRNRGRFFAAIGRPTAALRLYGNILSTNPNDGATLSRAANLAIRNGITAPLGPHFEAYLKARPDDPELTKTAANYFWHQGEKERAVSLYERLLTNTLATVAPLVFERLREFYPSQLPSSVVVALERARRENRSDAALVSLLAGEYAAAMRVDAEALEVYRSACLHDPENARLRSSLASALVAAKDWGAAATEAGEAARREPDGARLDVLAHAMIHCGSDDQNDAAHRLDALRLPTDAVLVVAERLIEARPGLRAAFRPLYEREARAAADSVLASILLAHRRLDDGDRDGARRALDDETDPAMVPSTRRRALLDVHRRYLAAAAANGRSTDAAIVARVAQLYSAARQWEQSIREWQSVVSVPEWNRRSMAAIQDILDRLRPADVASAYFATADWRVAVEPADVEGIVTRCHVTPGPSVSAELRAQFADTPVFCYSSVVSLDDVVQLKREVLASRDPSRDAVAFLVATQAVRHDVYALIYAFMTENPAVTVIPLEAQAIREAIVEARSRRHLERTLHQWLGHTDLYDTHNPVSNAATFFGRGHFINQLVLKISRGENFGIFGLRKIGKTSLVYRLRELSRDHLVAYVDLQGVASRRADEVYLRLIESLARDMRVKYPDVQTPRLQLTDTTVRDGDVAVRFHADVLALRRALERTTTSPPHVLLLLDEIELMVPYANSPGFDGHQDFFRHIRGLFQQERFIVSAVVGATPTVCRTAQWGARDNPVFQFYDEIFLAMLDRVDCDQMVQGLGELMGVRFDQPSLELVFEQTAAHPYVTRQLCSQLVRLFPERPLQVGREMVLASIEEYLAQRGDYFAGLIEGYLNDDSRRVVEAIAMSDERGESRDQLVEALAAKAGPHVVDRVLGDLELVGIVSRARDRYTLRAPLFRRWLRRSWLGVECGTPR